MIPGNIIEIGPRPFIWQAFPSVTRFYSTHSEDTPIDEAQGLNVVSIATLPRLLRHLSDPSLDLIVVHSFPFAPWDLRSVSRNVFHRNLLKRRSGLFRSFGPQLIRTNRITPMAVLDFEDYGTIPRSNIFMLDRATLYFKRELPADRWRVFSGSLHRHTLTPRFRMTARHRRRISKMRPLSLGLPLHFLEKGTPEPLPSSQKTTDVFFAGRVTGSSTVRERGLLELRALAAQGYVVDIPDVQLSPQEFRARCARAWISWSPEGFGWQCFRDFEALACGSVPLCNHPGIERYRPLVPGIHALYYDIEPGGLTASIKEALADRRRLGAIAASGRAHVLAWHTPSAIGRSVVETTMAEALAQGAAPVASRGCGPTTTAIDQSRDRLC